MRGGEHHHELVPRALRQDIPMGTPRSIGMAMPARPWRAATIGSLALVTVLQHD